MQVGFINSSEALSRVIGVCDLKPCVDMLNNPVALDIDAKILLSRLNREQDEM